MNIGKFIQTVTQFYPQDIEDSVQFRIYVLLTVSTGIFATVHVTESPISLAIFGILFTALGKWVS